MTPPKYGANSDANSDQKHNPPSEPSIYDALDEIVCAYTCPHGLPAHYGCSECKGRRRVR